MLTAKHLDAADSQRIADAIRGNYIAVRILPDGSVAALRDLLYTRAIFLGCDICGYARRFCFEDRALADQRFAELVSEDDEPAGWVARR